eukprot:2011708-Prymnesium_polylepis.1
MRLLCPPRNAPGHVASLAEVVVTAALPLTRHTSGRGGYVQPADPLFDRYAGMKLLSLYAAPDDTRALEAYGSLLADEIDIFKLQARRAAPHLLQSKRSTPQLNPASKTYYAGWRVARRCCGCKRHCEGVCSPVVAQGARIRRPLHPVRGGRRPSHARQGRVRAAACASYGGGAAGEAAR